MPNSLYPGYIRLEYTSEYAPHIATLPLGTMPEVADPFEDTTLLGWDDSSQNLADMVADLVTTLVPFYTEDTVFTVWSLYTLPDILELPEFRGSVRLTTGNVGTNVGITWNKAVEYVLTWRTTEGGISKIVLLDAVSGGTFEKITDLTGHTDLIALDTVWTSLTQAWAGRDTSRPSAFLQATKTLNDKLRKEYRLQ